MSALFKLGSFWSVTCISIIGFLLSFVFNAVYWILKLGLHGYVVKIEQCIPCYLLETFAVSLFFFLVVIIVVIGLLVMVEEFSEKVISVIFMRRLQSEIHSNYALLILFYLESLPPNDHYRPRRFRVIMLRLMASSHRDGLFSYAFDRIKEEREVLEKYFVVGREREMIEFALISCLNVWHQLEVKGYNFNETRYRYLGPIKGFISQNFGNRFSIEGL